MKFKIFSNELIRGGFILLILINVFNILNFVFHFVMARMLGPIDYGVLAVLMSFIYIFSIPVETIQTIISRYTSKFNIKKHYGKMKDLLGKALKKMFVIAVLCFIIFTIISIPLSRMLGINFELLALTGVALFSAFTIPIVRGILQGRKKFTYLGINMVMESVFKLLLAILFVYFGTRTYGAIGGVIAGTLGALLISFLLIKEITGTKKKKINIKNLSSYNKPILIATLVIVIMYSIDIILAKKVFSPEIAGQYAVASMIGKIIFFGTFAISKAMFPITSENFEMKKINKSILYKSFGAVFVLSLMAVILIIIFPKILISILFGKQYIGVANILVYVGIAFSLFSLSNVVLLYGAAVNKLRKAGILFFCIILEIVLLLVFSASLMQFSMGLLISSLVIFIMGLILTK